MNKNPKIVQFESDDFYQTTLDLVFYNMGLDSPRKIENKDQLKAYIKEIESNREKPDVAIIDSFLEINNEDGRKIADKLKEIVPNVKIIGYSIMDTSDWADYSIIKSARDNEKTLIKILEEVLGIEFKGSDQPDPEYTHAERM